MAMVAGSGLVIVMVAAAFRPVTAVVSAVIEAVACGSWASQVNDAVRVMGSPGVPSMVAVVRVNGMLFLSVAGCACRPGLKPGRYRVKFKIICRYK